jgi:hypothetical protein
MYNIGWITVGVQTWTSPGRAAIILPVKSQYTQQDTAKIVITCTAENQRQLPAADQMHVCMQAITPQNSSTGPAGTCRYRCEASETILSQHHTKGICSGDVPWMCPLATRRSGSRTQQELPVTGLPLHGDPELKPCTSGILPRRSTACLPHYRAALESWAKTRSP